MQRQLAKYLPFAPQWNDAKVQLSRAGALGLISLESAMDNEPILQFFTYQHLPVDQQPVWQPFCELAHRMVETLPQNCERDAALRSLLEAKDAAERACLYV
jgi:hypothetical protein